MRRGKKAAPGEAAEETAAAIKLELAVAEAIKEFEATIQGKTVVGFAVVRMDREMTIEALIV